VAISGSGIALGYQLAINGTHCSSEQPLASRRSKTLGNYLEYIGMQVEIIRMKKGDDLMGGERKTRIHRIADAMAAILYQFDWALDIFDARQCAVGGLTIHKNVFNIDSFLSQHRIDRLSQPGLAVSSTGDNRKAG
jgi:hypothetical protein